MGSAAPTGPSTASSGPFVGFSKYEPSSPRGQYASWLKQVCTCRSPASHSPSWALGAADTQTGAE